MRQNGWSNRERPKEYETAFLYGAASFERLPPLHSIRLRSFMQDLVAVYEKTIRQVASASRVGAIISVCGIDDAAIFDGTILVVCVFDVYIYLSV